jgi:hypothetical protein
LSAHSSLLGAARIGAKRSGADPSVAPLIAELAEELVARLVRSEDELRDVVRELLLSERHPTWFEAPLNYDGWRESLVAMLTFRLARGERRSKRRLRLVPGGLRW